MHARTKRTHRRAVLDRLVELDSQLERQQAPAELVCAVRNALRFALQGQVYRAERGGLARSASHAAALAAKHAPAWSGLRSELIELADALAGEAWR